jgi:hypothetical protein
MAARTNGASKLGAAEGCQLALRKKAAGRQAFHSELADPHNPVITTARTEWLLPFRPLLLRPLLARSAWRRVARCKSRHRFVGGRTRAAAVS